MTICKKKKSKNSVRSGRVLLWGDSSHADYVDMLENSVSSPDSRCFVAICRERRPQSAIKSLELLWYSRQQSWRDWRLFPDLHLVLSQTGRKTVIFLRYTDRTIIFPIKLSCCCILKQFEEVWVSLVVSKQPEIQRCSFDIPPKAILCQ